MSPKKAYDDQKRHAESREIPWLFTYAEWLEMWLVSGKWEFRGKTKGAYQMCRFGDTGAYSTRNCRVDTVASNQQERHQIDNSETEAIKMMYRNTTKPQWEIAELFGLHQSSISRIVRGERRVN